jgi:hypothetical protein
MTVLPLSPLPGVYVNAKGDAVAEEGVTEPAPFSVMVTLVALPEKVLPSTVTGVVPHVDPEVALSVSTGAFTQPQDVAKMPVLVTHPCEFLTDI